MIAIGQPKELQEIMNVYCQVLIPYIFLVGYAAILERTMQALNMNMLLFACYLFQFLITPPFAYFFMYTMQCGYYGAAIARSLTQLIMVIAMIACLVFSGYGYLFIPHRIFTIWTRKGIKQYIYLALPGTL